MISNNVYGLILKEHFIYPPDLEFCFAYVINIKINIMFYHNQVVNFISYIVTLMQLISFLVFTFSIEMNSQYTECKKVATVMLSWINHTDQFQLTFNGNIENASVQIWNVTTTLINSMNNAMWSRWSKREMLHTKFNLLKIFTRR